MWPSVRGLWRLTWLETNIFVREPMGVFGTVGVPVLVFLVLARLFGPRMRAAQGAPAFVSTDLPILASLLIAASAVLSLVTIVAIYREGGILKRLRATPLRPYTILTAHVLVKLLFTAITLVLMSALGRRYYPAGSDFPVVSFAVALLISTVSVIRSGSSSRAWCRRPALPSRSRRSWSIRCLHYRGCSFRLGRCRQRCRRSLASCRSPTRWRC